MSARVQIDHRLRDVRKRVRAVNKRLRLRKRLRGTRKRIDRAHRRIYAQYNRRYRFTYARDLSRVPARDELPAVLNARGLTGTGVEIGVQKAKYSDHVLANWRGAKLISIDPWREAAPDEYRDRANVAQEQQERTYEDARRRLARHGARSEIWRTTSIEAAPRVADGSLDFVYLDARHDYESVLEDLDAWFPKVRPGGILAGHDYADGQLVQGDFGVKRAVDEFFAARGIPVHATDGRPPAEMFPSWIVAIPRR